MKHKYWGKYLCVLGILLAFFIITGCGETTETSKPPASESSKKAGDEVPKKDIPMPKSIDEMKQYLSNFIPPEFTKDEVYIGIDKSTNIPGTYLIDIDINTKKMSRDKALVYARKFIFAAYKAVYHANLPVIYVSSMVFDENDKRILAIGIGKKIANKLPKETWSELKMSPSDFEKWAIKNYNQNMINGKTFFDGRCFVDGQ